MDPDKTIAKLVSGLLPPESQVIELLHRGRTLLLAEGNVLQLSPPLVVVGDIHGQFHDLQELFRNFGTPGLDKQYLFLGDFVDRGYHSLQTMLLLLLYKLKFPTQVHLIRGNHETRGITKVYGFYQEIKAKYGNHSLWRHFMVFFDALPLAALAGQVFACHGGLSPFFSLVDDVRQVRREIQPEGSDFNDLLWSDPFQCDDWMLNERGRGWFFGEGPLLQFLQLNKLNLLVRSHQLQMRGFQMHFGQKKCVTVWSAPNYLYRLGNEAAVMSLSEGKQPAFLQFKASKDSQQSVKTELVIPYFM